MVAGVELGKMSSAAPPALAPSTPWLEAAAAFRLSYGEDAGEVVYAPGRVNLIGEHTDYNGGYVLPMAIDRGIFLAARRREDGRVRIRSAQFPGEEAGLDLAAGVAAGEPAWSNYVRGVLAGFLARGNGLPGFDAMIYATLPVGGGVSSSAALEVAAATLCEQLSGRRLAPVAKALLCQEAEHAFAGTPCGIMDQFVVVLGRAGYLLLIDCQSQEARQVAMPGDEVAVLVINTMVKHALNDGSYRQRREDCAEAARLLGVAQLRGATPEQVAAAGLEGRLERRARHVTTEDRRTLAAVAAVERGDWAELGRLMAASHASLRDDFEVSCAELDAVVAAAEALGRAGGVYGCRMTGGGFGGCCVALVQADRAEEIATAIGAAYERKTGLVAVSFTTRPSDGPAVRPLF